MTAIDDLLQATIASCVAPNARLTGVRQRSHGAQGFSGTTLRYFDVTYEQGGAPSETTLVVKNAGLVERHTLVWLAERGLPVPCCHTPDVAVDAPAAICMRYAGEPSPPVNHPRHVAMALAAIHHAALGRRDALPWLPAADPAFFADRIVDTCWRRAWRHALTGTGYTDWYGRWHEPRDPDPFWAQFAAYDAALEAAAARFVSDMATLWREGDALTLLHADFHAGNVRATGNRIAIIDWEQACYGPLFLDLPNHFTREQSLLYRDALAALGHTIPPDAFLARYDAASRYIGFKYFGIGVLHPRPDGTPRRPADALYWIEMALHGCSGGRPIPRNAPPA